MFALSPLCAGDLGNGSPWLHGGGGARLAYLTSGRGPSGAAQNTWVFELFGPFEVALAAGAGAGSPTNAATVTLTANWTRVPDFNFTLDARAISLAGSNTTQLPTRVVVTPIDALSYSIALSGMRELLRARVDLSMVC